MINSALAAKRTIAGPLAVGAGPADWYRAGGAPVPWAAYQSKGAASLAASYLDLSGNGNNATPVVAPTWNATDGQIYSGTQYLTTAFVPNADQTQVIILQFTSGPGSGSTYLTGSTGAGVSTSLGIQSGRVGYYNGDTLIVSPALQAGNLAVAGNVGYRNGSPDAGTIGAWGGPGASVYIGCRNNNGTASGFAGFRLQAFAIYDNSTNHAVWVPAVAAAMAAL